MAVRSNSQQAVFSSYAPRLRTYNNALLQPILPGSGQGPLSRTTKRGTAIINYAEDGYDDLDDDEDDGRRRPTGLRSLRRDDSTSKVDPSEKVGKDTSVPVEMQGYWRDWMGKNKPNRSDVHNYVQACLPLTLIPIRIDLDIPSFTPQPPLPPVPGGSVDNTHPLYKPQEPTVPYRLRDTFLWNLHESLITTDYFATQLVQDLDLPNKQQTIAEISKQIRTQLEEYAGVALHPLFHARTNRAKATADNTTKGTTPAPNQAQGASRADTPNAPTTSFKPGAAGSSVVQTAQGEVSARATPIPPEAGDDSPDDTYRCIINLNITLSSQVYTDKFEWSLLHPPGTAEIFAKQTCADLGLYGEWVPALTHAIYEAVLKLKKEACEAGGLVAGWTAFGSGTLAGGAGTEFPNDAAPTAGGEGAGWRYDPEHLAEEWEPKLETLSKEEIEKREGDRERQIRRLRRETARFSSNTGMAGGIPIGFAFGSLIEQEQEERLAKLRRRRRFRSPSPGRDSVAPGRGTPAAGGAGGGGAEGYGGGGGTLTEAERTTWRCSHCRVWGTSVWAVRDGPFGPRSLCNNCGFMYERDRKLPRWTKMLHANDPRPF
ncbi:putative chromatin structure-remodeling complex protein [Thermochaetoides thermophila DSM 1495]|uniref:Putative chromatin structure-remodeling complex protein n=1 Tax=Chaetomium thermophilum (strain DSM 1495 / CBS 144.50 / IMI 039719) TaxID=759272 RepID=G0S475_CHATD|nr:putative chromatin structure-remodeling complex protein [Thermochaetoides thermophila DSM 1495]EGS21249.1 putative chromatin structure-remodeling complex protein [Thermochaetoides thermophila DSM 1495]